MMRRNWQIVFVIFTAVLITACNSAQTITQPTDHSNGSSNPSKSSSLGGGLTNAKVETAVNSMLSEWRLSGSVRVKGIQEIPQQNAAIADLQFEQFEYGVTTEGGLVKAKDFAPKPMPKGQDRLPTMEEMFPQRKTVYSKDGKATLSRYNDGRWVLKDVRWGFDTSVRGNIEIR